jgi:ADP-heptose:LPS heptosyltransferase
MPGKLLCIQLKQIGDVLMTTPAIRALSQELPDMEIHYLTQVPSNQIFTHNPYVKKTILFPAKPTLFEGVRLIRKLRREKYSVVVDFLGLPKTALLSWFTGAQMRIGFKLRGRTVFYSHALETPSDLSYSALQKSHLLSPLGVSTQEANLDFFISQTERRKATQLLESLGIQKTRPVVSISPVSRREYKIWPAENFARIADYLVEKYSAQILFLWGPGEYHFVKQVKDLMKRSSLPKYDVPTIAGTIALLEQVDLHVGNDNGPMHFAVAAGTRSVAVFGRPHLKNWTPPGSSRNLAIEVDPGCKHKCVFPKCKLECLLNISPEMLIPLIDQQFEGISGGQ